MQQRTSFETLLQLRMLDAGLVPHASIFPDTLKEVRAYMATLDPDARRRCARKFRKMWRKAADLSVRRVSHGKGLSSFQKKRRASFAKRAQGRADALYSSSMPTHNQMRDRSRIVIEMFLREIREEMARDRDPSSCW